MHKPYFIFSLYNGVKKNVIYKINALWYEKYNRIEVFFTSYVVYSIFK